MKKKSISLFLALCLVLTTAVFAFASVEQITTSSSLFVEDGTVKCSGVVSQYGSSLNLTMRLLRNGRVVRTLSTSGNDYIQLSDSYPAVSGSTYQLSFVCYVDGNSVTIPTKTLVCP